MPLRTVIHQLKPFAALDTGQVEKELTEELRRPQPSEWLAHASKVVRDRMSQLVQETQKCFVGRDREVELMAAAFASGVSLLLLGPPGTAKTQIAREFATRCGVDAVTDDDKFGGFFDYLLTNHTMPEEIFGGPRLEKLTTGVFERNVRGKLPEAQIAFLDELFRGGSHILNTLLTLINEKRYDRGDGRGLMHVPLLGVVGASNNPPQDPDLEAFFDRFPIRVWMRSVFEADGSSPYAPTQPNLDLLHRSIEAESRRLVAGWDGQAMAAERQSRIVSCTHDFRFARVRLLRQLKLTDRRSPRFTQFDGMFRLVRERARLSDRAYGHLWLFGGAIDWLRGKEVTAGFPTSNGHLEVFRHVARVAHDVAYLEHQVDQHTRGLQHTGQH